MTIETSHDYGQLILQRRCGDVSVIRVRLYDDQRYNWHQHLITSYIEGKKLHKITDQAYDLKAYNDYTGSLDDYKKVWFNGVLIYKRPWWKF